MAVSDPSRRKDGDAGHELLITEREDELFKDFPGNLPSVVVNSARYEAVYEPQESVQTSSREATLRHNRPDPISEQKSRKSK